MKKAIIILGMHRSGTSAIAGALHNIGIELGNNFLPANSDNPFGYWENKEIVNINDEILSSLGRDWHDIRDVVFDLKTENINHNLKETAIDIIIRNYFDSELFLIKDPRICRLIPFWASLLNEISVNTCFVILTRNPYEVADSLSKRDSFSMHKSLLLWAEHVLKAEKKTRGFHRIFITYNELLNKSEEIIEKIFRTMDLEITNEMQNKLCNIETFLTTKLKHHNHSNKDMPRKNIFEKIISDLWILLESISLQGNSNEDLKRFNLLNRRVNSYFQIIQPWINELQDNILVNAHLVKELYRSRIENDRNLYMTS